MKKQLNEINVGSLLKEISTASEGSLETVSEKTHKSKAKPSYEVVFHSINDFAIRKKTKRLSTLLVSIYSQDMLFIYNEITQEIKKIEKIEQLHSFFSGIKAEEIAIPKDVVVYSKGDIYKSELEMWFSFLKTGKGTKILAQAGFPMYSADSWYTEKKYAYAEIIYQKEKSLLKYVASSAEKDYNVGEVFFLLNNLHEVLSISNLDTAKYFFDKWQAATESSRLIQFHLENMADYNLNTRQMIDYILFDLERQGMSTYSAMTTYSDYLKMAYHIYGKVKDKYPKTLMTDHQILTSKTMEQKMICDYIPKFEKIMSVCEDFSYSVASEDFEILMPQVADELIEEGDYLCHCVGSYILKVVDKDCIVVFMRQKKQKENPYLTVEILPDRTISQVEGMNKRSELTDEEKKFIMKWAKEKSLKVTAANVK